MREITSHTVKGNELNERLSVVALDEKGSGGANHKYEIRLASGDYATSKAWPIDFQNGAIAEAGPNGLSNEALLAIVIDRLEGFEAGPFASDDNANALSNIKSGLAWLRKRTTDRLARGVEGKSVA